MLAGEVQVVLHILLVIAQVLAVQVAKSASRIVKSLCRSTCTMAPSKACTSEVKGFNRMLMQG